MDLEDSDPKVNPMDLAGSDPKVLQMVMMDGMMMHLHHLGVILEEVGDSVAEEEEAGVNGF